MPLVETIVQKMSSLSTPQRKFLGIFLTTIQLVRGKLTFRNLRRYRVFHEKASARHVRQSGDVALCHYLAMTTVLPPPPKWQRWTVPLSPKGGPHASGIDSLYHASHHRPENGLEFSAFAVVDVDYGTAYHLSIRHTQTPPRSHALMPTRAGEMGLSRIWTTMARCYPPRSSILRPMGMMRNRNLAMASASSGGI